MKATSGSWEQTIQGNWFNFAGLILRRSLFCVSLLIALSGSLSFPATGPKAAKKTHRTSRKSRKKVVRKPPPPPSPKAVGAAGLISISKHDFEQGNFEVAATHAADAAAKAPILNDYAHYYRAQAEYKLKNYPEVAKSVTQVFNQEPLSPFVGPAAALAVTADLDSDNPKQAFELVRKYFDRIPQPQATLLLARCFQANGDLAQAAEFYHRVYYNYPATPEATVAANALPDVKQRLGDAYPPVMPAAMLGRAEKLLEAHRPADAGLELNAAIPQLAGAQRDIARVRLGEAEYYSGKSTEAIQYFKDLKVDDPEADAERLNYLIRISRRMDHNADVKPFLSDLETHHPTSTWRMDALINVADQARSDNDSATYLPLYTACATTFPTNPKAAWCAWRVAFDSYHHDKPDAYDLLVNYIKTFPDSSDTSDALYFLGRLAEHKNDFASARAAYEELVLHFPNSYYATLAQDRLKATEIKAVNPNAQAQSLLRSVAWTAREKFPSFSPGPIAQKRLARAQLLQLTGLNDLAEDELKFGAHNDGEQQNIYSIELAKIATAHGAPDEAIRYIKMFTPAYLYMPLDQAPLQFWQLAFPLPFRGSIDEYSRAQGLDPFLVAALIRQESEFDTKVISHAHAYGLMQLLPTTGR